MQRTGILSSAVSVALAMALVFAPTLAAQGNPAGQVTRVIPAVALERGGQTTAATASMPVMWEDVVSTQKMARARIDLTDGSVLNVGSESTLKITKHDPTSQQTQIDLSYGRLRSRAVHLSKPKASFEVHSPVGTAGVVGTDFYLAYENGILRLIVFEGRVKLCNLAGVCVIVGLGELSTLRGSDQSPDQPVPATSADIAEAIASTAVTGPALGEKPPPHHSPWYYVGIISLATVPAAVLIPVLQSNGVPNCQRNPKARGC